MPAAYRHTLWAAMAQLRAIVQDSDMNLFVQVPEPLVESFGKGKRPPILVTVNGVDYRTRVMVYGGKYLIGFRRDITAAAGLAPGQEIELGLELDESPRDVELPEDFAAILAADSEAARRFEQLSFSNRKEYVDWLQGAKRAETRQRRLAEVAPLLKSGRRTPL
jgi:hypothetical protein